MLSRLFSMSHDKFWSWFAQQEDELARLAAKPHEFLAVLAPKLRRTAPGVLCEFSVQPGEDGRLELILSADGIRDQIPAVRALVAAAPALRRWRVTAFRPRDAVKGTIEMNGLILDPATLKASIEPHAGLIAVVIFVPGVTGPEAEAFTHLGFLLLDTTLGELDVMTKVGPVDVLPADSAANGDAFPFVELAQRFDAMASLLGLSPRK